MTPADVQAEKRFKQLFKSKGYYNTATATEEEEAIYNAYKEAIGDTGKNESILNSRSNLYTKETNGDVSDIFTSYMSDEDLATGDITRYSVVDTPAGITSRFVTPTGIEEQIGGDLDPTFNYIPLRAPQSWAVQPGNLNRYSRARGGLAGLLGE